MEGSPVRVIQAGQKPVLALGEAWEYRELFLFLAWRNVLVRYKQTAIGIAWAVLRPLLTMTILTVVFGRFAGLPSGGVPYELLVLAAMIPWQFVSSALMDGGNSLVGDASLLTKVYFPRVLIPGASILAGAVDFAIGLVLLLLLGAWHGCWPGWQVLALPLFAALALALALGAGLGFAALNARYRDFRYVVPFVVQLGTYLSPVGFSSAVVPEHWRLAFALNPLVGILEGFRWALLGGRTALDWRAVGLSVAVTLVILAIAIAYFRETERVLADVI